MGAICDKTSLHDVCYVTTIILLQRWQVLTSILTLTFAVAPARIRQQPLPPRPHRQDHLDDRRHHRWEGQKDSISIGWNGLSCLAVQQCQQERWSNQLAVCWWWEVAWWWHQSYQHSSHLNANVIKLPSHVIEKGWTTSTEFQHCGHVKYTWKTTPQCKNSMKSNLKLNFEVVAQYQFHAKFRRIVAKNKWFATFCNLHQNSIKCNLLYPLSLKGMYKKI